MWTFTEPMSQCLWHQWLVASIQICYYYYLLSEPKPMVSQVEGSSQHRQQRKWYQEKMCFYLRSEGQNRFFRKNLYQQRVPHSNTCNGKGVPTKTHAQLLMFCELAVILDFSGLKFCSFESFFYSLTCFCKCSSWVPNSLPALSNFLCLWLISIWIKHHLIASHISLLLTQLSPLPPLCQNTDLQLDQSYNFHFCIILWPQSPQHPVISLTWPPRIIT